MAEAAVTDGARRGRVTEEKTRSQPAPSTRAWSSIRVSRPAQWAPTTRTTTA